MYPKTDYTNRNNKEEKVGQDKPEKKPSTAARFARSIGMKRNEKETKLQNGETGAGRNTTQTTPAIMPHQAVSRNLIKSAVFRFALCLAKIIRIIKYFSIYRALYISQH